jgi:hypothetical protein
MSIAEPGQFGENQRVPLLIALFVAVLAAVSLFKVAFLALGDPDTLWHIRVGGDIWRTFRLPVQDTYSFTFSGHPWIAKEWLAQLLLSASYALGGWSGVIILCGISVGITAFLFCHEVSKLANPRTAAIMTIVAIFLTSPIFVARPQILILPLAIAWTASLFRAAERQVAPSPVLLAILVAWANLHASFLLAVLIAGFAFLHLLETGGLRDRGLVLRWLAFVVCCLPASLMTPYGFEPLVLAIKLSRGNEWVPIISEWLPFNAKDKPVHEAALLVFFAILLWTRPRLSLSKIAFVLLALHMFLLHQRFVFMFALLVPLAVIGDLVPQESRLSFTLWARQNRDLVESLIIRRMPVVLCCLAIAVMTVFIVVARNAIEPPSGVLAGKAIQFAEDNLVPAHVLNGYSFGGTLIFHDIPTFVDGRTDQLFLGKFATDIADTVKPDGTDLFVRQLNDYRIEWTLLQNDDPRNLVLATLPRWQRVYSDKDAMIYKRISGIASDAQGENIEAKSEGQ